MTRYSNLGLKRKYVQATAQYAEDEPEAGPSTPPPAAADVTPDAAEQPSSEPAKKKRKRSKAKKAEGEAKADGDAEGAEQAAGGGAEREDAADAAVKKAYGDRAGNRKKHMKQQRGAYCTSVPRRVHL